MKPRIIRSRLVAFAWIFSTVLIPSALRKASLQATFKSGLSRSAKLTRKFFGIHSIEHPSHIRLMPQLEFSSLTPAAAAFKSLYDTTGWGPTSREVSYYQGALSGSWFTQSAYSAGQLVGFARVISDGHLHAFITEMIVRPQFQGLGIGSTLLSSLLKACHGAGITDIQLFSARGKSKFYERHGFVSRPSDGPGMQFNSVA